MTKQKIKEEEERKILEEKVSIKLQVFYISIIKHFNQNISRPGGVVQWSVVVSVHLEKTRKRAKKGRKAAKRVGKAKGKRKNKLILNIIYCNNKLYFYTLSLIYCVNRMFEKNETTKDNLSLEISDAIRCGK